MIYEDWESMKVLSPRRFFGAGVDGCPPVPFRGQDASAPVHGRDARATIIYNGI